MNLELKKRDETCPYTDILNGKWNKKYFLHESLPFYFQLKDSRNMIQAIQSKLKENDEFRDLFNFQQDKLSELKSVKIWLKNENGILKMSLYDVYSSLLRYLKDTSFEEQLFGLNSVSLMGPLGPFKEIPLITCLNEELINHFIFKYILKSKLSNRGFRVRTEGEVRVQYGDEFNNSSLLNVKQITDSGILFSSIDENFQQYQGHNQLTKVYFDPSVLESLTHHKNETNLISSLFYTNSALNYFLIDDSKIVKSLSYNSVSSNEIFFFCRYQHMKESDIPNICTRFLAKMKDKMISYL